MSFELLEIIQPIHKALTSEGYETPTPIQSAAIPKILEGRDILGSAQTGTGKTAAFAVPILQLLHTEKAHANKKKVIHALILSPTRELALQIGESFSTYGRLTGLTNVVVFGGVPQKSQTDALKKGVDILIATPGRLLDLLDQKFIKLDDVKIFVLDEADRMLDMGFIHDIKKVIALLPEKRQNLLFSATIPPEIAKLSESILHDPVTIDIVPETATAEAIQQGVYYVAKPNKKRLLLHVLEESKAESIIVFTRTKYGAEYVARFLHKSGISAEAIHSDKVQKARQRVLQSFKNKEIRVLVATDIAARGLDIEQLAMVINYEIPNIPDSYIHRIGRTGRAGLSGIALSFCDAEEKPYLKDINKNLPSPIPEMTGYPFALGTTAEELVEAPKKPQTPRPHNQARNNYSVKGTQQKGPHAGRRTPKPESQNSENAATPESKQQNRPERKPFDKNRRPAQHRRQAGENNQAVRPTGDGEKRTHNRPHAPARPNEGAAHKPHTRHTDNQSSTEGRAGQHPRSNNTGTKKPFKKSSDGEGSRNSGTPKRKSEVWSNDASFNRRRSSKPGEKNFNREEPKKNTGKPRIISNDYKPVYDKSATPANKPPKREKLSWYERLGFKTKKKRPDGNS